MNGPTATDSGIRTANSSASERENKITEHSRLFIDDPPIEAPDHPSSTLCRILWNDPGRLKSYLVRKIDSVMNFKSIGSRRKNKIWNGKNHDALLRGRKCRKFETKSDDVKTELGETFQGR